MLLVALFFRFSMPDVLFALWIFVFFFVVVCVCHLWPLFVQTETKNSQESPIYKFAEQWCYKQKQTGTNRQQENEEWKEKRGQWQPKIEGKREKKTRPNSQRQPLNWRLLQDV